MGELIEMRAPKRLLSTVQDEWNFYLTEASRNGWANKVHCVDDPKPFTEQHPQPTQEEAQELCAGCPMFELCEEYAKLKKPRGVVLGGISWGDDRRPLRAVEPADNQSAA